MKIRLFVYLMTNYNRVHLKLVLRDYSMIDAILNMHFTTLSLLQYNYSYFTLTLIGLKITKKYYSEAFEVY